MSKQTKEHIGTDGNPMSKSQVWLLRLCWFSIAWACAEAALAIASIVFSFSINDLQWHGVPLNDSLRTLGISAAIGSVINAVVAGLGIRGAKDPQKITLYFWVALANGVLCAWELVSAISNNSIDPASAITCVFVIVMAVCAWNVRGQTGYFDKHPQFEDGATGTADVQPSDVSDDEPAED